MITKLKKITFIILGLSLYITGSYLLATFVKSHESEPQPFWFHLIMSLLACALICMLVYLIYTFIKDN